MRLIDADILKARFAEMGILRSLPEKLIDEAPTIDAVEVIRCKDCIDSKNINGRTFCNVFCCYIPDNDFCAGGRKEGKSVDEWCREKWSAQMAELRRVRE